MELYRGIEKNIRKKDKIIYMPIYMAGMLTKEPKEDYIYTLDLHVLQ